MITAAMVKELRERTGAGMVDCKNALKDSAGDVEQAVEILRKKGMAALSKKAGRIASEGVSYAKVEDGMGIILEVNSETDFVAKNAEFTQFVADVAKQIAKSSTTLPEELLKEKWLLDTNSTVEDILGQKTAIIGEKLNIRRFEKYETKNTVLTYIHAGGKVASMLELTTNDNPTAIEAGKNIAMQIAAMNPMFLDRSYVSEEFIEKEKAILTQQAIDSGKPANVVEKMVEGRLSKSLKEICLMDQEYVKDGDMTVKQYLDNVSKEAGTKVSIVRFVRYETGEGLEKKEDNFAEEVAKTMQS
ncbi:MAG: translation elongation factor Ts [Defluviitaleaceae bacterium]|nr:translation elongation factor Ts [Defluviitaleaceae bacterium]